MQSESFAMANVGETVAKYVGHKVAKVRWIPQVQGQLNPSETFVTGGWDDQASFCIVEYIVFLQEFQCTLSAFSRFLFDLLFLD